jgi:hypothetical protein
LAISRPIVVTACMVGSSESWGPQQRPHPWHFRAGGGAVHSIKSRDHACEAGPDMTEGEWPPHQHLQHRGNASPGFQMSDEARKFERTAKPSPNARCRGSDSKTARELSSRATLLPGAGIFQPLENPRGRRGDATVSGRVADTAIATPASGAARRGRAARR